MSDPVDSSHETPADTPRKKTTIVSNAPPPPTILRGSWVPPKPKPTEAPDNLPPYYPAAMVPQTNLIIYKAVNKFSVQTHVVELCKYVVTELRPHFGEALRNKMLRQDEALRRMQELIHHLLVHNCDSDSRRYELKKELERSGEWMRLVETIAGSTVHDSDHRPSGNDEVKSATGRISATEANPHTSVPDIVSGNLGAWAARLLPEMNNFAKCLRAGGAIDPLRTQFSPLFVEVLDRLPGRAANRFVALAQGKQLTVPELLEPMANVKQIATSTLNDHLKKYRQQNRVALSTIQSR